MIHLSIAVYMSFFWFSSHIVYYAVLIRSPHPIVGFCWLFYKESCVRVHVHLLISFAHHLSLLVTIGTLLCCEAASVWWRSSFVPVFSIFLQEMSCNSCLPLSYLLHLVWCLHFLPCCWTWCNVPLFVAERHCSVCVPHLGYPFICPYPLRLHPCLGYCT